MKLVVLILSFSFSICAFGQTLFFDNLNTATWISQADISDSILINSKHISLTKLSHPVISLKEDNSIWKFRNGVLTIEHFNAASQITTSKVTYPYKILDDGVTLQISINKEGITQYKVGITSTGTFVILTKQKNHL